MMWLCSNFCAKYKMLVTASLFPFLCGLVKTERFELNNIDLFPFGSKTNMKIEQLPVIHVQHNYFSKKGSRVLKIPSCCCSRAKIYLNNQFLKVSQFFFSPLSAGCPHSQVKTENGVKERTNLPLWSFGFSFFYMLYRKDGLELLALYTA